MVRAHDEPVWHFGPDDAEPVVDDPSPSEVMQDAEPDMPTVPVRVEGLARVQVLPAQLLAVTTVVANTTGVRLLADDPMRSRAVVLPLDGSVVVGERQASLATGGTWPAGVPMVVEGAGGLWAQALTSTVRVTVVTERWTS